MRVDENVIAILPMKGHSERVPGKNIKILGDRPLFYHVADQLRKVSCLSKLIINTDSEEIAQLALERYSGWVEVSMRPKHICGDSVSMNNVLQYEIDRTDHKGIFLQTHSTNPFLQADTVSSAIQYYRQCLALRSVDSIFSVKKHYSRMYTSDFRPINHDPSHLVMTQSLDPILEESSTFYLFTKSSFNEVGARIGRHPGVYPLSRFEVLDIDYLDDWDFAQMVYEFLNKEVVLF